MSEPLPPDVIAAMNASNKIEAIRLLRAQTGLGLAEAKEAVEDGYVKVKAKTLATRSLPTQIPAEAVAALQSGSKIDAIRIVRAKFGIDLKDAKEVVDAAMESHPAGKPTGKTTLAPGEVPHTQNGIAILLIVVVLSALGAWWAFTRF